MFWVFLVSRNVLVGALDAHEHAVEVGVDHQPHELVIVRQIERGLGHKCQRITLGLLPGDQVPQNLLNLLLVADEIVIDDEDGGRASPGALRKAHIEIQASIALGKQAHHNDQQGTGGEKKIHAS